MLIEESGRSMGRIFAQDLASAPRVWRRRLLLPAVPAVWFALGALWFSLLMPEQLSDTLDKPGRLQLLIIVAILAMLLWSGWMRMERIWHFCAFRGKSARAGEMWRLMRAVTGRCFRLGLLAYGLVLMPLALVLTGLVPVWGSAAQPCALLTLSDVQRVLGGGFEFQSSRPADCNYIRRNKDLDQAILTLRRHPGDTTHAFREAKEAYKKAGQQIGAIPSLGKEAFYAVSEDGKMGVFFGKGDLIANLAVYSGGKPNLEAALKLAKIVYARL